MTTICRRQLSPDHQVEVEIQAGNNKENGGNLQNIQNVIINTCTSRIQNKQRIHEAYI